MVETILPDVYIDVRAEGLIAPAQVTVGRLGVVGTASRGPITTAAIKAARTLGSLSEARQVFGEYDRWIDGKSDELTLVRALELAFANGASSVFAARVAAKQSDGSTAAVKASKDLASASGVSVKLAANTEGTWGKDLTVEVGAAEENPFVEGEKHDGPGPITLGRQPVVASARNRVRLFVDATGETKNLQIIYDDNPAPPVAGQVKIDRATGDLTFGDVLGGADKVTALYLVNKSAAKKVTVAYRSTKEVYTVIDGKDLIADVQAGPSALIEATAGNHPEEAPSDLPEASFSGGDNAASGAGYQDGLDALLDEEAHIILLAGQDDAAGGGILDAHCQNASTDVFKRDRIGVIGSKGGATIDDIRGHSLASDRVVFVAPGITMTDGAATPPVDVTLPGSFAAAAVAGLLGGLPAHVSPTNKVIRGVKAVDPVFGTPHLAQLVQSRVLALTSRQGFRIVKGITTSTNSAFAQITTRRIVDYAKYGVRSAATPYIGLLNNERVRAALRATVNSFLAQMVLDEMLVSYDLEVGATRDEEIQGIARVTMTLRPTFSIDYIKVTMFLE
jgi:Phage tail sheath protein subtilisin-like domain/Phage tail sheath C-terminal domain